VPTYHRHRSGTKSPPLDSSGGYPPFWILPPRAAIVVSRGQLEFGQCISGGIAHGTPASWMRCANDSVAATNEATTVRQANVFAIVDV